MSRILVLGDIHIPYVNWGAIEAVKSYYKSYKPDLIIQMGDLIDAYNWSLFKKAVDSPNAEAEWASTEDAVHKLCGMFGKTPWVILEGNHCRRYILRALDVNLPKKLIRTLDNLFPFEHVRWHMEAKPFVYENTAFIHGDEMPGNAWQKAQKMGVNLVQGHDHLGYLQYISTFNRRIFGMSVGCLMDTDSIAARYAAKNPMRSFVGWATITDGVPALHPYE